MSWQYMYDWYKHTESFADPRVADWPFISTPIPTICFLIAYHLIVQVLAPKYMKNRDPLDFGLFLSAYNFALVALNYYIFHLALTGSYGAKYSYVCTPTARGHMTDENEMKVATAIWWFYASKLIELSDTVLFLLRKNQRQVTFLHVYHHTTMPIFWWIGAKWVPGGQPFFGVMLNSAVHVVMYSYYGLSALGPHMRKYLWWKKYITKLQLAQFVIAIFHTAQSLYIDCPAPKWMHWALIGYAASLIVLFLNFYVHTYLSGKRPKTTNKTNKNGHVATGNGQGDHKVSSNGHKKSE